MIVVMQTHTTFRTFEELAQALRVSRRWLRGEVRAGRLPFLQAGRKRLFDLEAVTKVLADRAATREGGAK